MGFSSEGIPYSGVGVRAPKHDDRHESCELLEAPMGRPEK
jgi:hypothetical protein